MSSQNGQPPPMDVVAVINIALTPQGVVMTQFQGSMTRQTFNMMMETAKQDMLDIFRKAEAEKKAGIALPPPGMQVARNDGG